MYICDDIYTKYWKPWGRLDVWWVLSYWVSERRMNMLLLILLFFLKPFQAIKKKSHFFFRWLQTSPFSNARIVCGILYQIKTMISFSHLNIMSDHYALIFSFIMLLVYCVCAIDQMFHEYTFWVSIYIAVSIGLLRNAKCMMHMCVCVCASACSFSDGMRNLTWY